MNIEHIFDRLYAEKTGLTEETLTAYRQLYDLKTLTSHSAVSYHFFDHASAKDSFVTLTLYDAVGRIYLVHDENGSWSLPGTSVQPSENIHEAVQRVAASVAPAIRIGEIEPVVFVENTFEHKGMTHTHSGIAFMARVRNMNVVARALHGGRFVQVGEDELDNIRLFANREIARACIARIGAARTEIQEEEIATNEAYKRRYEIHGRFVKRYLLTDRRKRKPEFMAMLSARVDASGPLLDASCGDDGMVSRLLAALPDIPFAVANDISWSQLQLIDSLDPRILLTNHDAVNLPFRDNAFATALCCNTLHHMPSRRHMAALLDSLLRVSRRLIFVEIEKPEETGGFPLLLHKYWYVGYLKDVGGAYLRESDFRHIIATTFAGRADVTFDVFRNLQGKYMIATIDKKGV